MTAETETKHSKPGEAEYPTYDERKPVPSAGEQELIMERLLTVAEAAAVLGTSVRFPRRLIAERRIRFVHVGRHVRIPVSAIVEFIEAGTVKPLTLGRAS